MTEDHTPAHIPMPTPPKVEARSRKDIADFLPRAIERAIKSYDDFSKKEKSEQAKNFKEHHDACKVAVAHIELLIKLAKWADLPDPDMEAEMSQNNLAAMILSARAEMNEHTGDMDWEQ